MSRISTIALSLAFTFGALCTTGCSEAECNSEAYTFEQSPGEAAGVYRGLRFGDLTSVDLAANADGDQGTMTFIGVGEAGDDDDSAGDDDDSSAGRDFEELDTIDEWRIDLQWEDTRPLGRSTDGQYALKSSGSDCTTHGNKCFEAQMSFNGEEGSERWRSGRLEIFDLGGGLRGCMLLIETVGDPEAQIDLYFTP